MKLVPSSSKFPSGIKHLAEQVHQKGENHYLQIIQGQTPQNEALSG